MAEVHLIGEIESASGFPDNRLFCKWSLEFGGGWSVVEGDSEGQTQIDLPEFFESAYFAHPIDVHLATKTIQGWPLIKLEVWHYDEFGRQEIYGYCSSYVPMSPGEHEIKCRTWRPKGSLHEEMLHYLIGGGLQLTESDISDSQQLSRIKTVTMGIVILRISVITRHFDKFGIVC